MFINHGDKNWQSLRKREEPGATAQVEEPAASQSKGEEAKAEPTHMGLRELGNWASLLLTSLASVNKEVGTCPGSSDGKGWEGV